MARTRANQRSIDYWRKREEAAKAAYIKEEAVYQERVNKVYQTMKDECQKEIDAFYAKYAGNEGLTIAEAKKRVSQLDIDEYARKAERYVREKNFSDIANEEMKLYNLTMKVNRLELLKAKLGAELVGGFDEIDKITEEILGKRTIDELKRQAGILGESVSNQKDVAKTIVTASFHNATFSEDIWMYQDALRSNLNTLLQRGLVQGKHPRVLAREIEKAFGSSRYEAERLMRTELARVQIQAAEATFKANDYDQYIFLPHDDACTVCLGIRDEVYNVADMEIGVNAPPMHPNCRCSIAAYMDRAEFEKWLEKNSELPVSNAEKSDTIKEKEISSKEEAIEALKNSIGFKNIKNVEKLQESTVIENTKQLEKLENKFGAVKECAYPELYVDNCGRRTIACVHQRVSDPHQQTLHLDINSYKNNETLVKGQAKATETGWAMPALPEYYSVYSLTHEYGHILQNIIIGKEIEPIETFKTRATTVEGKIKAYGKYQKKIAKQHFDEIMKIAKEIDPDMKLADVISGYGKTNYNEFFAEVFANAYCGKPNTLGKAMKKWLSKRGYEV